MHMDMSQEPFDARIFQENCRAPEVSRTFCASQRDRNAHGHVTRAILCGNMQGKCWRLRVPPSMNTGPYCFVKNGGKRYLFGAGMIFLRGSWQGTCNTSQAGLFATLLGKLQCGEPWLLLLLLGWHHLSPNMDQPTDMGLPGMLPWRILAQFSPVAQSIFM